MKDHTIKIAFGSVPKDGGTFTFYKNQAPQLRKLGIEMFCVSLGPEQADLWEEDYADDHCVLLAPQTNSVKKQAKVFVDWCVKNEINIVMAINSKAILSALPHLPENIRVVSRCANAFDHGYRITMSGKERLAKIIALTPRLKNDLVKSYDADPALIELIPNGIDVERFSPTKDKIYSVEEPLVLGFLGRLEHNQKGVLHLPHIVRALNERNIPFQLNIAGKGKHRSELETALTSEISSGQVKLLGALNPDEIPQFLESQDLFIFTSHFEGCPNALLEAMMASSVPVSWIIEGITDFIIEDDRTGYLLETGDYKGVADRIAHLHLNRSKINELSASVKQEAISRFSSEVCAKNYKRVFEEVMESGPISFKVKSWNDFVEDPNFDKPKLHWLPYSYRKQIKRLFSK